MPAAVAELVEAFRRSAGPEAVVTLEPPAPAAAPAGPAFDWRSLPPVQRRILRAASVVGNPFEARLLAGLLRLDPLNVLEALQEASEAGLGLEDRGGGQFVLPAELLASARQGLLPSLEEVWHRRTAQLLGGPETVQGPDPAARPRRIVVQGRAPVDPAPMPAPPREPRAQREAERPPDPAVAPPDRAPSEGSGDVPAPALRARDWPEQPLRAAAHAEAAGDVDQAVERLVQAAAESRWRGVHHEAHDLARRAVERLDRLPATPARQRPRARALLELGLAQAYGPEEGIEFSLEQALSTLDRALDLARTTDDAELQAEVASAVASVCYDIGSPERLERALAELTSASRTLIRAGLSLAGARLLNDQAAVWVRIGDPVRAHHLLEQSRQVFAQRADRDPAARGEMAETEHLLARLVLHVQARPGREADALEAGIAHAEAAAEAYESLGLPLPLARVWETLGRLRLAAGQLQHAADDLGRAAEVQEQLGDPVGLARTAAGYAEVLMQAGDPERALMALRDSIQLNAEKGATLGLEFNRQTLDRLAMAAGPHRGAVKELGELLEGIQARMPRATRGGPGPAVRPGEAPAPPVHRSGA
jgi:tetratricopeptide (TPR) repeat protein